MKKLLKVLSVMMIAVLLLVNVNAQIEVDDLSNLGGTGSSAITGTAGNIWQTIVTIVQILAIAAVVFAGIRYMFASADQKADIKKSMGILVVGAVLVFGASTLLKFVSTAANEVVQDEVVE